AAGVALAGPVRRLLDGASALGLSGGELESLRRAVASDASAWAREFGTARDVSALHAERNVLRYLPVPVWVRSEGATLADLLRVVASGLLAGSDLRVSTAEALPPAAADLLTRLGAEVHAHDAEAWRRTLAGLGSG